MRLAWRFLRRDWRSGELAVVLAAMVIAVAVVSAVGFFTDRVERALAQQSAELLGADLVVQSDRPLAQSYVERAEALGLRRSEFLGFPSMAWAGERSALALVGAVDDAYPLRGRVYVSDAAFAADYALAHGPAPGTVWLEARLLTALGLQPGQTLQLGNSELSVAKVLVNTPGAGGNFFNIAPRLLMHRSDLAATGLIQPASRRMHQLLLSGAEKQIKAYRQALEPRGDRGVSWLGRDNARPEVRTAIERGSAFLGLASLSSVTLAGLAVALAARRFARRHLDQAAVMRCLGASQGQILGLYLGQLLLLALIASLVGGVIGWLAHYFLVTTLGGLLGLSLPAPGGWPLLLAALTAAITLFGFALPPMLQLKEVPALRVLRRELGALGAPGWLTYTFGLAALTLLASVDSGDPQLALILVAGACAGLALLTVIAWLLVRALTPFKHRSRAGWRFGLASIPRRAGTSVIQVVAFGLGLMVLILLTMVRGDLLDEWQHSLPADAPNRFLINIQPEQRQAVNDFFAGEGQQVALHPMVRARLVAVNGREVAPEAYEDDHARRLSSREFNLSWAARLPEGNRLAGGRWWRGSEETQALLSVEEGIAQTLGLALGDELRYDVAGRQFSGRISNLREVDWDSFRANFFVLTTPTLLQDFPASYMTAFYLPAEKFELLNRLVQRFPNITVIDVAAIMSHVREIIERVTLAVEAVFLFTLASGLMVLYAGIQTTHDERMLENAVIRTLGGRRWQVLSALWAEFLCLGALAGAMAVVLAALVAAVLAERVMHLTYLPDPAMLLGGLLAGALGVGLAGVWGNRRVVRQAPAAVLRSLS